MKHKTLIVLAAGLALMLAHASAMARPYGLADRAGVWRDAAYWHANHPDWVYRYHPEWVVDQQDWWVYDHQMHPEWFNNPFWQEYPIWTYGAYDRYHVWRYAGWWRARDPAWFYANHPRWAEPYPDWIRADHASHPEWFKSDYWHDHPHDWNHPDEVYRDLRKAEYHQSAYGHNDAYSHQNYSSSKNYSGAYHSSAYNSSAYHSGAYNSSAYHSSAPSYSSSYKAPVYQAPAAYHPSAASSGGKK